MGLIHVEERFLRRKNTYDLKPKLELEHPTSLNYRARMKGQIQSQGGVQMQSLSSFGT
jgi:hypothetical protein